MKKAYIIMMGILCFCLLASCSEAAADSKSAVTGLPTGQNAASEDIAEEPAPFNVMSIGNTVRSARISDTNDENSGTEPAANTSFDGSNYTTNYELPPQTLGGVEFSLSKNRGWFFYPKVKMTVEKLHSVISALKSSYGEPLLEEEDMFYLWQSEDSHFEIRIEYYNTPTLKRFYFRVSIPSKPSWLPDSAEY